MVDLETRPNRADKATRSAVLWATAVALPVAVLVGVLIFVQVIRRAEPAARPSLAVTTPAAVPAAPVEMAAPRLPARAAEVCLAVTSQLPARLRDLPVRKVTAGPEQNAAYGEPPITVACGVAAPVMCRTLTGGAGCVPLDAVMLNMNGVCWYGEEGPATNRFTTMDREIAVRVSVPSGYAQPGQWANEFSDTVVKADKSVTAGVPSGCL
jgi:hypothetical protein